MNEVYAWLAAFLLGGVLSDAASLEVDLPNYGVVRGVSIGNSSAWLGLPFAADPVGSLRFAPPVKRAPWRPAVLNASKYGPSCVERLFQDPQIDVMDERCLSLCIFTPADVAKGELLPVMAYIHGGSYAGGAANESRLDGSFFVSTTEQ